MVISSSQQQGITWLWGCNGVWGVLNILRILALGSPGRRKVAKWKSEVNESEVFMVKDGCYESEKWIMPEAAIYL